MGLNKSDRRSINPPGTKYPFKYSIDKGVTWKEIESVSMSRAKSVIKTMNKGIKRADILIQRLSERPLNYANHSEYYR